MIRINEVSISNFKGIKECKISDLSRVNLFIGRNNCGKSSILEALCFVKAPLRPVDELDRPVLQQLLQRRVRRRRLSTEEFFYNYKGENKVDMEFLFNEDKRLLIQAIYNELTTVIRYNVLFPQEKEKFVAFFDLSPSGREVSIWLLGSGQGTSPEPLNIIRSFGKGQVSDAQRPMQIYLVNTIPILDFLSKVALIDADFVVNIEEVERSFWSRILKSRLDKKLTRILNTVYGTEIENLTIIPYYLGRERRREEDSYKLVTALAELSLHIDDYGEGLRYAFSILSSALLLKDTALLIEEIESHQHPGSLRKLIRNLVEISRQNNLQLFITTHSYDAWRYFYYEAFENDKVRDEEFRSFHVVRDANTGKVDVSQEYNIETIQRDIFEIEYPS